jgi:hypothetical protein
VDANVEHHAGGSQRLLVKRAETVGRAVEVPEFRMSRSAYSAQPSAWPLTSDPVRRH